MSGWHEAGGAIEKTFAFNNYYETIAFVNALAWIVPHRGPPSRPVGQLTTAASCASRPTRSAASRRNDFICAAKADALVAFVA